MKRPFVVANGKARDVTGAGAGRFFPADLLGKDTHEIEREMRRRYAEETRSELPDLMKRVRSGDDEDLLHLTMLFADVDGVRDAVLEGFAAIGDSHDGVANFAQAISLLKARAAAPMLHARLRALPVDTVDTFFRTSALASCLLILDDNDEVAAKALAAQLGSAHLHARCFAAHRACECDVHDVATSAIHIVRNAVTSFVGDDDMAFESAAPLLLAMNVGGARERAAALLARENGKGEGFFLWLLRDALEHRARDEAITAAVIERGLAHASPGVRLDSITLLGSLPHLRHRLARAALVDEPDEALQRMLRALLEA